MGHVYIIMNHVKKLTSIVHINHIINSCLVDKEAVYMTRQLCLITD